jgi:serine/threonine-protein kinase
VIQDEPLQTNTVIGKYRLVGELGVGGMARVLLGFAESSQGFRKLVVIKVLRAHVAEDSEFLEMFLGEARIAARLNHPNVVQTFDAGTDNGRHYLAMEYVEGVSLSSLMNKVGWDGIPFPIYVSILVQVLQGLDHAHDLKDFDGAPLSIVHRDVSPQNVMVGFDGHVRVVDFGIAKAATNTIETETGIIKGKLPYMAPEQARGRRVDRRADIYAVGVMLWERLAGRRRFPGQKADEIFANVLTTPVPESPNAVEHGLPARAEEIAYKALTAEPEDRYPTCAPFIADLELLLAAMEKKPSAKETGALVSTAFAEKRQAINTAVEEALHRLDATTSPQPLVEITLTPTSQPRAIEESKSIPVTIDDDDDVDALATTVDPKTKKRRWWVGLAAVAALPLVAWALLPGTRTVEANDTKPVVAPQAPAASVSVDVTPSITEKTVEKDPPPLATTKATALTNVRRTPTVKPTARASATATPVTTGLIREYP